MFGSKKEQYLAAEDNDLSKLMKDQMAKECIEVQRRAWCINQATLTDDCSPSTVVALAERIYGYVFGDTI